MTDVPEKDTRSAFRESGEFIITSKAKLKVVFVPLKLFFVMFFFHGGYISLSPSHRRARKAQDSSVGTSRSLARFIIWEGI